MGDYVGKGNDRGGVSWDSEGKVVGIGGSRARMSSGRGMGEVAEGIIIDGGEGTLVEGRGSFDRQGGRGNRPRGGTDGGTRRSEGAQSDVLVKDGGWRPCGSRGR